MDYLTTLLHAVAFIPTIVTNIESLFGDHSGTEKKAAAMSFLETALSLGESISNRQITDEAKFREGLSKLVDGAVECLNASVWAKAQ